MSEGRPASPITLPNVSIAGLSRHPAVGVAIAWYGIPLSFILGLISSLIYVTSPEVTRPLFDDSYISLTFARNIAEHGKLSFDGQYWSTGATSPLHVTVLAFLLKLGVRPMDASIGVGVVSHAMLSVAVYLLGWAIFRSRLAAILGALAIAFTSYAALDSGNGLETSLFMAICTFAVAAYFLSPSPRARWITGVLVGLAVLTRPEGAFLIPAMVLYRWIERPDGEQLSEYARDITRLAGPGVGAGLLLVSYSLIVSGTLGGTASAKLRFFQENRQTLVAKISISSELVGPYVAQFLGLVPLAVIGRRREAILIAIFWVPVMVAYTLLFPGGLNHYFSRYQHPTMPFIATFAGGGAAYLLTLAYRRDYVVKALVVAGLVLVVVPMWKQYENIRRLYEAGSMETYRDLEAMAIELNSIVEPNQVLATHDIGAVGYFAHYGVLDLVGLVNEEVIKFHKERQVGVYLDIIKPDYLLIFPDWDVFFLWLDTANQPERYELVKTYPGGWIRYAPYLLYRVHYN